jgi:hypothetical protein
MFQQISAYQTIYLHNSHAAIDIAPKTSVCLMHSSSARTAELLQHVLDSCKFTGTSQHTGNAAQLWEYNGSLRSMKSLDSKTVGYDLIGSSTEDGDYFDKAYFYDAYTNYWTHEPYSDPDYVDKMMERY